MNQELLSILTPELIDVELEMLNETITIRPYTHGDTKAFLEILEQYKNKRKGATKKLLKAQRDLVNKCIISRSGSEVELDASNLHRADYVKLLVALKNHTKGEDQSLSFRCVNDKCSDDRKQRYVHTIDFLFEDCVLEKNDISNEIEIKVNGKKITFHMNPYTFGTMISNSDLYEMDIPNFQVITKFQACFINAIETEGQLFDNLTTQDKIDFLNQLAPKYQEKISEYVEKQEMYVWKKTWECPVCGAKNDPVLDTVQDFFF